MGGAAHETTLVTFRPLTPRDLAHYVADRRVGRPRRRVRDPGPRREPRRADRGRLPERRRPAGRAARAAARDALPRRLRLRLAVDDLRAGHVAAAEDQPPGEQRQRRVDRAHPDCAADRLACLARRATSQASDCFGSRYGLAPPSPGTRRTPWNARAKWSPCRRSLFVGAVVRHRRQEEREAHEHGERQQVCGVGECHRARGRAMPVAGGAVEERDAGAAPRMRSSPRPTPRT